MSERDRIPQATSCLGCGGDAGRNYFDRTLCPCGTGLGTMHTRCDECGLALDGCPFEEPYKIGPKAGLRG